MSIVYTPFEEELQKLLKEVGLGINHIESYETRDKKDLILYLKDGKTIRIRNKRLVELSRIRTNEKLLESYFSRKALLERLYLLENLFVRRIGYEKFERKYSSLPASKLIKRIIKIEENNKEHILHLKDYLITMISNLLTIRSKSPYYPEGIEEKLHKMNTQELIEIYNEFSSGEISEYNLQILLNIK
jgi:hypothetical protein